eukprot:TCONS_00066479-protein
MVYCLLFIAFYLPIALVESLNHTDISPSESPVKTNTPIRVEQGLTVKEFCKLLSKNFPMSRCKCPDLGPVCGVLKETADEPSKPIPVVCGPIVYTKAIITISLSALGILGNIIVIILSKKNWNSSAFCHKLIGALAMADLLFIVSVVITEVPKFWTCLWIYGEITCKFIYPMTNMTATLGLGFVLIISVERYIGITYPFSRGLSSTVIYSLVALNAIVSTVSVIPASIVLSTHKEGPQNENVCNEVWKSPGHSRIYTWVLFVTSFAAPVIIITVLYLLMLFKLKKATTKCLEKMTNADDSIQLKRKRENKRVTAIVMSLLVAFVLFVSPNRVFWIIKDEGILDKIMKENRQTTGYINLVCDTAYIIHAVINPFIYSVVDSKFRSSLKRLFTNRKPDLSYSSKGYSYRKDSARITTATSCGNLSQVSGNSKVDDV